MAKRRLTLQQRRRIAATQAGKQADNTKAGPGAENLGTVVARYGNQADIETRQASGRFRVYRCHIRANVGSLATGDSVTWRKTDRESVVVAVHPRHSEITRPDNRGNLRTIAANVDIAGIVVAPEPELHTNLIDRYLVAAEACAVRPLILCNKTDLFDRESSDAISGELKLYDKLGYPLHFISAKKNRGIEALAKAISNSTTVFVGQSGVGKSSLINALCPDSNHSVGELSEAKAKGTHTTTTTRLCHLPEGGTVIDSPGIREFGLWHLDRQQVENGFIEFRPFLGHCKFRNCSHTHEAGCAIMRALAEGKISEPRMASYRHIMASISEA